MFTIQEEKSNKLFQGVTKVQVTKFSSEKSQSKDGTNRLDFALKTEDGKATARLSFFIENEFNVGKNSGKTQWISTTGQTKWFEGEPVSDEYFNAEGARKAYRGEENITKFIRSLFNISKETNGTLGDPKAIAEGNVSELESYMTQLGQRKVWVAFNVKDGKYQDVYNGEFQPGYMKDPKHLIKTLGKDTYFKGNAGVSPYPFQEYDENAAPKPTEESALDLMSAGSTGLSMPSPTFMGGFSIEVDEKTSDFPPKDKLPF